MDLRKLKTLIDLVAESGISELEVTEGESKVKIVKGVPAGQNQMVMMQPIMAIAGPLMSSQGHNCFHQGLIVCCSVICVLSIFYFLLASLTGNNKS